MLAFTTVLALTLSAPPPAAESENLARHLIGELAAHKFATAGSAFSPQMHSVMTPAKLGVLWSGLENQKGAFQKIERASSEQLGEGTAALLSCRFAKAAVTFQVYVDPEHHVAGLLLSPASLIARRFLTLLDKSDVAGAEAMLDSAMQKSLPAAKLTQLWKGLVDEAGKYQSIERSKVESAGGDWAANVSARFAQKTIQLRVAVDGEGKVMGFVRQ